MRIDLRPQERPAGGIRELTSKAHPGQIYYLYLPSSHNGGAACRLLVTIHGQSRRPVAYAERFTELADEQRYVVLAPLFSARTKYQNLGIGSPHRADLRLLDLVEEVAASYAVETAQFDLFGYSGGAQFAHRFLYVHPDRLRSVVVGAPGTVTVPSRRHRWPAGIGSLAAAGVSVNLESVRRRRIMLIVGDDDVTLEDLNQSEDAMRFGATRLGRARRLHAAWTVAGIPHEYVEVPGSGHGLDERILEPACRFFADGLQHAVSLQQR